MWLEDINCTREMTAHAGGSLYVKPGQLASPAWEGSSASDNNANTNIYCRLSDYYCMLGARQSTVFALSLSIIATTV